MPVSEFYECLLYDAIEPFGDRRGDIQAGMICATLANIHRDRKAEPFKPTDFLPDWDGAHKEPEPQSPDEQLAFLRMAAAIQNSLIEKAKG